MGGDDASSLPAARRARRPCPRRRSRPRRLLRHHRPRRPGPAPRPRRPAAGPPEQPGQPPDLSRQPAHPLRSRTGVRPAPALQLGRIRQRGRPQVVRKEIRRRGPAEHLLDPRRSGRQARRRRRRLRRLRPHPAGDQPPRRGQADPAAEPELHPQPAQERLEVPAEPLVRRRLALHRPLHGLLHRDRLAQRLPPGLPPVRIRQPLRQLLADERNLGQGGDARRSA